MNTSLLINKFKKLFLIVSLGFISQYCLASEIDQLKAKITAQDSLIYELSSQIEYIKNGSKCSSIDSGLSGTYQVMIPGYGWIKGFCDLDASGGGWLRVFLHDLSMDSSFFASLNEASSSNSADPASGKYSILGLLEYLKKDGKFTFMIRWSNNTEFNVWSQTSNPLTEAISGYNAINVMFTDRNWGGLEKGNQTHSYIDGSVGVSGWYYAVASIVPWQGGIPGPNTPQQRTELLVKF